jgi:hypothetical protein
MSLEAVGHSSWPAAQSWYVKNLLEEFLDNLKPLRRNEKSRKGKRYKKKYHLEKRRE